MNSNQLDKTQQEKQESMLTEALERRPEIAIPADFHLRLRASIAFEPALRSTAHISFARTAAYVAAFALAIILAVLTVLYPNAIKAPDSMTFILELIILAQLMAVGFWLGMRREG